MSAMARAGWEPRSAAEGKQASSVVVRRLRMRRPTNRLFCFIALSKRIIVQLSAVALRQPAVGTSSHGHPSHGTIGHVCAGRPAWLTGDGVGRNFLEWLMLG